jgi:hypothetical protein
MNNIDMGRIGRCLELHSSIVHTITIFFGEIFPSINLVSLTLSLSKLVQVNTVHHQGHHAAYTKKLNAALNSWRQENSSVIID